MKNSVKQFIAITISIAMLFSLSLPVYSTSNLQTEINIGDYLILGKYYDEPILWRCVSIDENGPLMLSDRILCLKAYDAKGNSDLHYVPNSGFPNIRKSYGSNCWEEANIRQWLNSNENNINWTHDTPVQENVANGYNAYADEAGFLSTDNFSAEELSYIKPVTRKVYLNSAEVIRGMYDGGTTKTPFLGGSVTLFNVNHNSYYYRILTDKIFLINSIDAYNVYKNLGNYICAKLTQKAIDNSNFKDSSLNTEINYGYYLCLPANTGDSFENMEGILADGSFQAFARSYDGTRGIRPAFYLDTQNINLYGDGSLSSPYYLSYYPQIAMGINCQNEITAEYISNNRFQYNPNPIPMEISYENFGGTVKNVSIDIEGPDFIKINGGSNKYTLILIDGLPNMSGGTEKLFLQLNTTTKIDTFDIIIRLNVNSNESQLFTHTISVFQKGSPFYYDGECYRYNENVPLNNEKYFIPGNLRLNNRLSTPGDKCIINVEGDFVVESNGIVDICSDGAINVGGNFTFQAKTSHKNLLSSGYISVTGDVSIESKKDIFYCNTLIFNKGRHNLTAQKESYFTNIIVNGDIYDLAFLDKKSSSYIICENIDYKGAISEFTPTYDENFLTITNLNYNLSEKSPNYYSILGRIQSAVLLTCFDNKSLDKTNLLDTSLIFSSGKNTLTMTERIKQNIITYTVIVNIPAKISEALFGTATYIENDKTYEFSFVSAMPEINKAIKSFEKDLSNLGKNTLANFVKDAIQSAMITTLFNLAPSSSPLDLTLQVMGESNTKKLIEIMQKYTTTLYK